MRHGVPIDAISQFDQVFACSLANMSSKAHHVANLISCLGGPSLNLDNIAWANDLEAGNLLLSWLADQLGESTTSLEKGVDETREKDEECKRHVRAAIGEVALEPEEVIMFVHHPHSRSHYQHKRLQGKKHSKCTPEYVHSFAGVHASITTSVCPQRQLYHCRAPLTISA